MFLQNFSLKLKSNNWFQKSYIRNSFSVISKQITMRSGASRGHWLCYPNVLPYKLNVWDLNSKKNKLLTSRVNIFNYYRESSIGDEITAAIDELDSAQKSLDEAKEASVRNLWRFTALCFFRTVKDQILLKWLVC